jgi:hypothetical protein
MSRWTDRLLAAVGLGGRKPEADVSWEPAKGGPRKAETKLGTTSGPQEPPKVAGTAGPEDSGSGPPSS